MAWSRAGFCSSLSNSRSTFEARSSVPEPPAALEHTIEARGRMDARGIVIAELDERDVWMVLQEVLSLVTVGLGIGLAVAWGTTRYIESFLFGMKHNDPLAISLSVGVLVAATLLAGYVPASRASRKFAPQTSSAGAP